MRPGAGLFGRIRQHAGGLRVGRSPHSLAVPYALHALDPPETRRFETHLERCPRCTDEVRALAADTVRLARAAAVPAPPDLRERILAAVRAMEQEAPHPRPQSDAPPDPQSAPVPGVRGGRSAPVRVCAPVLAALAASAAALALVAAGLLAFALVRADARLDEEKAAAREIAHVLAAPDARAAQARDARGRGLGVVASRERRQAVVTAAGLGGPPEGRAHQLWVTRAGAPPRSLGLLDGETPVVAHGLRTSAESLAVTVEPAGGSSRPTSSPVVQLTLKSVGFGE
ncbi:anti-sigma factor [Streptomyces aureocirculatus]|uniref:anti-sigma factor n=1 Tax=Streptomyces aureocirculatus TaxID=67275 RepID=UPI00099C2563|nr:anti-sigma factor [Streptomyces aureocirculatus]